MGIILYVNIWKWLPLAIYDQNYRRLQVLVANSSFPLLNSWHDYQGNQWQPKIIISNISWASSHVNFGDNFLLLLSEIPQSGYPHLSRAMLTNKAADRYINIISIQPRTSAFHDLVLGDLNISNQINQIEWQVRGHCHVIKIRIWLCQFEINNYNLSTDQQLFFHVSSDADKHKVSFAGIWSHSFHGNRRDHLTQVKLCQWGGDEVKRSSDQLSSIATARQVIQNSLL